MTDNILPADQPLNMVELAEAIGCRRAGRPTWADTCSRWCLVGLQGVRLYSWKETYERKTTWGHYLEFCQQLERARAEARRRRLEAARTPRRRQSRERQKAAARRRLEEMGAR